MGITQQVGASSLIKPGVIDNTAARPASPYEGQAIYQKDTDAVLVWNGTAWYPNWNLPWGIVSTTAGGTSGKGYYASTSNFSVNTTETDVTGATVTFNAVSNRLYRATFSAFYQQSDAVSRLILTVQDASNAYFSSTQQVMPNNSQYGNITFVYLFSGVSGSITRKVRALVTAGTATMYGSSTASYSFSIEDIGPA
jgi:hypothetical protein